MQINFSEHDSLFASFRELKGEPNKCEDWQRNVNNEIGLRKFLAMKNILNHPSNLILQPIENC